MPSPDIDTLGILEAELAKQTEYVEVLKKLVGKLSRQLTLRDAELTILREDAAVGRALRVFLDTHATVTVGYYTGIDNQDAYHVIYDNKQRGQGVTLSEAFVAAGLIEEAE